MIKNLFILLFFGNMSFAQHQNNANLTISTEFFAGITLPSTSVFPKTNAQTIIGFSLGRKHNFLEKEWASIMKYPSTGISIFYTNFGNNEQLGQAISVLPFIEFNLLKKKKLKTKLAFGVTYFDTQYHAINNPLNEGISTKLTWALQIFLYYDLKIKNFDFTIGAGNFHHSNGHTKLPNFGMNAALLSFSKKFNLKKYTSNNEIPFDKKNIKKFGDFFYSTRIGYGIQIFLEENNQIKPINSFAINAGVFHNNVYKLSFGVNYRFYQHYYDYINENQLEPYFDNSFFNASNIYISAGFEALVGQVGIDVEGGLNLHKPFYKKHYLLTEYELDFKYKLKNLFLGRLGLKLYATNTAKKPNNNFYLSAHINSNLSQADFTEFSIGFTHRISK